MRKRLTKTALLVVDVQVAPFLWKDYGGPALYRGAELLEVLGPLIGRARGAGVPVVYLQYTEGEGTPRGEGQPLWHIHPDIGPQDGDWVLMKTHADPFLNTNLHERLQAEGIGRLVITGIQTEYCVDTACRSAYGLGYSVVLVRDGHTTFDNGTLTAQQIIGHHHMVLGGLFAELELAGDVVLG
ncbi:MULTISPECIES: cysteine hydrolase family protein [Paenibacillus]|uniref:cysteine hydrolase family protein n=1 Tax=Paenibacillus TaxID=44249 RepID=UPI0022B897AB|nr:cysteine hydrolase family protein [Paenibacillus caseinilyticus]MCZ8521211.1 cysteine hydrolase family protein [Paenibacillus caseinilyticus]